MSLRDRIIELRRIKASELTPNPANPRRHPETQASALRGILDEIGFAGAELAYLDDGVLTLIDGHLRRDLAGDETIPVLVTDLTREEACKLLAVHDPIAAMATTDREAMAALLEGMDGREQVEAILEAAKIRLPHPIADSGGGEPPSDPATEAGDLWTLGRHRLLCGDATDADDVARLLDGAVPGLCVTDPPYGVNYDPAWRNREAAKGNLAPAARRVGEVTNDDRADWSDAWALFPGDVLYSWHPAGAPSLVHAAALQGSGFEIRMQIIWAKSNFPIGRGDYHVRHEPCWYAVRVGKPARRTDDRTQTTLWEIDLDRNVEGGHSTQKPLECMARPMRNHEFPDVYDPFLGSGTTLIAAEAEGRTCYGLEIDPAYCDVIARRYQQATGITPERNGTPHTFEVTSALT